LPGRKGVETAEVVVLPQVEAVAPHVIRHDLAATGHGAAPRQNVSSSNSTRPMWTPDRRTFLRLLLDERGDRRLAVPASSSGRRSHGVAMRVALMLMPRSFWR
jgi:hypothetical protein